MKNNMKDNVKSKSLSFQEKLQDKTVCSVCQKEFKLKEKYAIAGGYACSWKCFLKEVKRREKEKGITGVNKKRKK